MWFPCKSVCTSVIEMQHLWKLERPQMVENYSATCMHSQLLYRITSSIQARCIILRQRSWLETVDTADGFMESATHISPPILQFQRVLTSFRLPSSFHVLLQKCRCHAVRPRYSTISLPDSPKYQSRSGVSWILLYASALCHVFRAAIACSDVPICTSSASSSHSCKE